MNRDLSKTTSSNDDFGDDAGDVIHSRIATASPQAAQVWITLLLAVTLAGTVAGYQVISFLPELLGVDSRVVTVPFRASLAGLYLAVLFLGLYTRRGLRVSLPVVALGLFLALYATRLLLDTVIARVPLELPPADYIAYFMGMSLLPIVAFFLAPHLSFGRWAFGLILLMSALTCAVSVVYNLGDSVATRTRMVGNECLNPITLGHTGVSLFLMVLLHWFQRANRLTTWLFAAGYGLLALLGLYVVVRAASRGSMVSLGLLLPLLLWSAWRQRIRLRTVVVGIGALAAVPFVVEWALAAGTDLSLYLGSLDAVMNGESAASRYTLITDAWSQFLENPVWGSSLVERNSLFYPHNYVVESFMATGAFGGLAFCCVVIYSVRKSLRLLWHDRANGWMALLYLQALSGGMFSGTLYYAPAFWALLGIVLAREVPVNPPLDGDAREVDSQATLVEESDVAELPVRGAAVGEPRARP